jgi:lipopolysaccharide export LptBFGC system permease protein LptF
MYAPTLMKTAGLVVAGTFSFFIITNFAVWAMGGLYPMTIEGLMACYIAGIPFYGNTLLSTSLFSALFFGLTKWAGQNNLLAADR